MGQPNQALDEPGSQTKISGDAPVASPPAPKVRMPRSQRKFGISLYHAWCKRCSICGAFCPTEALINDELGTPLVVDEEKCNGCLQCMHRCPDFCVEVYEKKPPPRPTNGASETHTGTSPKPPSGAS